MNLDLILKILNYGAQAAALAPSIMQSAAKVTDPNATAADKMAAIQHDVAVGHAIATASNETTQTFDEIWGPLSVIAQGVLSVFSAPASSQSNGAPGNGQ